MNRSQYRQLQVGVFALAVLFGATACSKHKADNSKVEASAPEQTQVTEDQANKQQDADNHSADYYKADNKQRVAEENSLLSDVTPKK